ncbi:MAG: hypothetical protein KAR20_09100 [Candidatus Heimdallarchaeota archaeon]|nr:hypothetical protein [Candidatus Heimdallarchaeota archaeon]
MKNGSPLASFETDEDRSFFEVTIPIHPVFNMEKEKGRGKGRGKPDRKPKRNHNSNA